jgi:DNA-3-methyladenine glycosylase
MPELIDFTQDPEVVGPRLLGSTLSRVTESGLVSLMITEVEAYPGASDPASHTFNGPTPRCITMFGPPGRLYVYASYGIHRAGNLVCRDEGTGAGVLLRAGRVLSGQGAARARRGVAPVDDALARGPGNLGSALGLDLPLNGLEVLQRIAEPASGVVAGVPENMPEGVLVLSPPERPVEIVSGRRIGISKNVDAPLRFWIPGDRSVTTPRSRRSGTPLQL